MFDSLALLRDLPDELKVYPGHACAPPRLDSPTHSYRTPFHAIPTPPHSHPSHPTSPTPPPPHSNSHPPTARGHGRLLRVGASGACVRCACTDGGASTTIGREKQAGLLRPISKEDFLRMFAR